MPQEFVLESERTNTGDIRSHLYCGERFNEKLVCPEPRRVTNMMNSLPTDVCRSPWLWRRETFDGDEAGHEILDIFLAKTALGDTLGFGCSPPHFSGSPPSRAQNPMVRDVEFSRLSRHSVSPLVASSSSSQEKDLLSVGAVASVCGNPPLIRIEGFDCSVLGFECTSRDPCHRVSAFA